MYLTSLNGTVVKQSADQLVGIGFTSQYWLQPEMFLKTQWVGVRPLHLFSLINI